MRLLLDSHALLWALTAPDKLSADAAREIAAAANNVWFSPASVWELELKRAQGKLDLPDSWLDAAERSRFAELPIRNSHAIAAGGCLGIIVTPSTACSSGRRWWKICAW